MIPRSKKNAMAWNRLHDDACLRTRFGMDVALDMSAIKNDMQENATDKTVGLGMSPIRKEGSQ